MKTYNMNKKLHNMVFGYVRHDEIPYEKLHVFIERTDNIVERAYKLRQKALEGGFHAKDYKHNKRTGQPDSRSQRGLSRM